MNNKQLDQSLVLRVQSGDKSAYDLLVLKYQHKVAKLVSRFISSHAEVEDVTQDVFIKAYRALANFRGDSAFYTWLYRIAVNTAKNHLVTMSRRPPSTSLEAEDVENMEMGASLRENATPESNMLASEIGNTVKEAIEKLPEDLKIAIVLREIDGLSYDEIASVMACPIGTVRSRIFRAREAIDAELRPLINNV